MIAFFGAFHGRTYGALSAKSAIKDVARVMGLPFAEVNELTRNIPALIDGHPPTIEKALQHEPKLTQIQEQKPVFKQIIEFARALAAAGAAGRLEGLVKAYVIRDWNDELLPG